jgi:hypothetical protein|tara:strand:+ start:2935 stop:3570 length:636 start_codon:yes stop_codon:yes gene_type:complete
MAITPAMLTAGAGLVTAYGASQAKLAESINQQTGYLLQARNALEVANVRADLDAEYGAIQAGRILQKAKIEEMNWKVAGNTLLRRERESNAAVRARAAANGIDYGGGSALAIQQQNTQATLMDVGVADFNALAARVLGFEDASAMLESTAIQNIMNKYGAAAQAGQYQQAAAATKRTGGLMSTYTLGSAAVNFGTTVYGETAPKTVAPKTI